MAVIWRISLFPKSDNHKHRHYKQASHILQANTVSDIADDFIFSLAQRTDRIEQFSDLTDAHLPSNGCLNTASIERRCRHLEENHYIDSHRTRFLADKEQISD